MKDELGSIVAFSCILSFCQTRTDFVKLSSVELNNQGFYKYLQFF